ncbi:hypothetical protein GGI04_004679, partial [Coemansia thaxteri]
MAVISRMSVAKSPRQSSYSTNPSLLLAEESFSELLLAKEQDDSGYPDNNSSVKKGSSLVAFVNILCLAIGVGSLQLAYTLRQSGWFGAVFVVLAACIAYLTSIITAKCMYLKP